MEVEFWLPDRAEILVRFSPNINLWEKMESRYEDTWTGDLSTPTQYQESEGP